MQTHQKRFPPGFYTLAERGRHTDRIGSDCYRCVDKYRVRPHFHRLSRVTRCANPSIDHYRYSCLVDDNLNLVPGLQALVTPDR
jgi:hypothetical protein